MVIAGYRCASPLRRSTWSSVCLVPGVDTAFDDFNNQSDFKINSTCRVLGCQQVANVIVCAPVCKNVEVVAMNCTSRISLIVQEQRRIGPANFSPCDWRRLCQSRSQLLLASSPGALASSGSSMYNSLSVARQMSNITISKCSSGSETPSVTRNDSGGDLTVSHGYKALKISCASNASFVLAYIDPAYWGWFDSSRNCCSSGHFVAQFD